MSMLAFQLLIVLRSAGSMVKKASRFSSILGSLVDYASTGQVTMCRDVRHARTQDRRATVSEDSRGGWKRWCRNKKKETGGEARGNSSCLTLGMQTKPSWRDHAISTCQCLCRPQSPAPCQAHTGTPFLLSRQTAATLSRLQASACVTGGPESRRNRHCRRCLSHRDGTLNLHPAHAPALCTTSRHTSRSRLAERTWAAVR